MVQLIIYIFNDYVTTSIVLAYVVRTLVHAHIDYKSLRLLELQTWTFSIIIILFVNLYIKNHR